jgi:NADPH-dependent curcumin reductase CurA
MTALLIGEVEASKSTEHPAGHCVVAWGSWETRSIVPAAAIVLKIDPSTTVPLETYMAVINTLIGLTAWVGVHRILAVKSGDVVCVSGAAGAVGSLVCQLAHKAGAKVVGICGSEDKCDFVKSLGCTGAINYKTDNVKAKLAELCPEGYTCYFDNVRLPTPPHIPSRALACNAAS